MWKWHVKQLRHNLLTTYWYDNGGDTNQEGLKQFRTDESQ